MDLKNHRTDPAKELGGVLVKFDGETSLLIGSLNSRAYKDAYHSLIFEMKRSKKGNLSAADNEDMLSDCYGKTILLGWNGLKEDGKDLPYSTAAAVAILKTCPEIREFVLTHANNNDNFRVERLEAAKAQVGEPSAGNSATTPATGSSSTS